MDPLASFAPATRAWFESSFAAPTPAQAGAWAAIAKDQDALVVAPTGSGKTLAAFLSALDRLAAAPPPEPKQRLRVLYVSPLKALAVDVERNLRAPLAGIRQAAARLGLPEPDVTVGVRSGDTPAEERRRFAGRPPDILITTPESLFLILTSQAREALRYVDTVIVDEIHAMVSTKRGAHLALSLERLDALLERPARRIGLSATVRPLDEVSRFLGGARDVTVVNPKSPKTIELSVVVPVEDMTAVGADSGFTADGATPTGAAGSMWPAVEHRIVELIRAHRSTIVFANSRRLAERLCSRLNEIAAEQNEAAALADDTNRDPVAARAGKATFATRSRKSRGRVRADAAEPHGREQRVRAVRHRPGRHRRAERDRSRPPRQRQPRAAGPDRGGAQGRPTARGGRHQQPRARHRHGRGRPGHPGRVAPVRRVRPAAGRPRGTPGRRDLPRRALPEVPRRPRPVGGDRRADARRRDRVDALPPQPARRAGPAGRVDGGDGNLDRRRAGRRRTPGRPVRDAAAERAGSDAGHALRPVPQRRLRRDAAADRLGPRHRRADPAGRRTAAGRHQRRHDPRPRTLRRLPGRGEGITRR